MEKKLYVEQQERLEEGTLYFKLTPKGSEKIRQTSRLKIFLSASLAILEFMARTPDEAWTAKELAHEDIGFDDVPSHLLQVLKQLESSGFVVRTEVIRIDAVQVQ